MTGPLKLCSRCDVCRLLSWVNHCLTCPSSLHRHTATTMEGIVTMYQDFMKKAGQWLYTGVGWVALSAVLAQAWGCVLPYLI